MLILVRHGRTELNRQGCLQGRVDTELDDHGRQQAADVAAYLQERYGVDEVVSSPLQRAQQTAAAFGAEVTIDDGWIELAYGEYDGMPMRDVPADIWRQWRTDPTFAPPGGESLAALDERVRASCARVAERALDANVVVVSHVSPMKAAVAWALGTDVSISWSCYLDQAAICRIAVRRGVTDPDSPPQLTTSLQSFNESP